MIKSKIISLLLILFSCSMLSFSVEKDEVDISTIGIGAMAMGRGGWYASVANGPDAALLNPAGLAPLVVLKGTTMYASLANEFNYFLISGVMPFGKWGNFGLSYITQSTDAGGRYDNTGGFLGDMGYSDSLVSLSWGKEFLNKKLLLGSRLKYYFKGYSDNAPDNANASGMGLDLGAIYLINNWFNAGIVMENMLLNKVQWQDRAEGTLPTIMKLGFSANIIDRGAPLTLGRQKLTLGLDYDLDMSESGVNLYHLGLEYMPMDFLALRAGLDQTPHEKEAHTNLTLGLGLNYAGFSFDYAYHPYHEYAENDTHYFSLSFLNDERIFREKDHFTISQPSDKLVTTLADIRIRGKILDPYTRVLLINGETVSFDAKTGNFEKEIKLNVGKNKSIIETKDEYGNTLQIANLRQLRLIGFNDVDNDHWAALPIQHLATLELVNGYPDGSFAPDGRINRAEASTLIAKARNIVLASSPKLLFKDLPLNHWANRYVNAAFNAGLVKGYPDGTFLPRNNITRAEGIMLMARFDSLAVSENITQKPYDDIEITHWVAPTLLAAKNAGYLSYLRSSKFEDRKMLTRAETVEIMSKTKFVKAKIDEMYDWDSY